jgi:hypothetical protein
MFRYLKKNMRLINYKFIATGFGFGFGSCLFMLHQGFAIDHFLLCLNNKKCDINDVPMMLYFSQNLYRLCLKNGYYDAFDYVTITEKDVANYVVAQIRSCSEPILPKSIKHLDLNNIRYLIDNQLYDEEKHLIKYLPEEFLTETDIQHIIRDNPNEGFVWLLKNPTIYDFLNEFKTNSLEELKKILSDEKMFSKFKRDKFNKIFNMEKYFQISFPNH